jgi:hypothetical protein
VDETDDGNETALPLSFTVKPPAATLSTVYPASFSQIVLPISSVVNPGPVFTVTVFVPDTVVHRPARVAGCIAISTGLDICWVAMSSSQHTRQ